MTLSRASRLEAVADRDTESDPLGALGIAAAPQPPAIQGAALGMILLGIKTLSQRVLVAIGSLVVLALSASVWWLFVEMPDNPSWSKITANAGYGIFVLTAIYLTRRR